MLPKIHRANPAEIILTREEGKLTSGSLFGLLVLDLKDKRPCRFAFIVSTKIDKRATQRNRIKRLLRQAVHQIVDQTGQGKVIVFLARKNLLGKNFLQVKKEVVKMFLKTGVVKK